MDNETAPKPRRERPGARTPKTRQECGQASMLARLSRESWDEMTAAANASERHISRLERWRDKARQENPNLSEEQLDRFAVKLRTAHFRALAERRWQAARAATANGDAMS